MWFAAQLLGVLGVASQALGEEPDESVVKAVISEPTTPMYQNIFSVGVGTAGLIRNRSELLQPNLITWNARYGWAPVQALTWEFGYIGGTNTVVDRQNTLMVTLIESTIKWNLLPRSPVVPFVAGGAGYGLFSWEDRRESTMTVPLVGGLDIVIDYVVLEARATVRPKMFGRLDSRVASEDWMLEANLGSLF